MVGTVLGGRYELQEKIGEGGMANVYTAHCRILDRIVAVKILKEEFSQDKNFVNKFRTEALAAASLSHPNIVNIFDVGQEDGIHYIVMEYVEGQTLQDIINDQAPLPVKKAVDIAIMICYGIQHAHERGIIHRDVKPHNILVTTQGTVKVADFGIAQAVNKKTITFGGDIEGSVHYISPEQAKGEAVTPATDIYSLGCVLYEMLTAQPPFDAESMITVALKHIHNEPVSPRLSNPLIPMPLEKIILKAMEKIPTHRYASAWEMSEDLLNVQANMHARANGDVPINNGFMSDEGGGGDGVAKKRKLSPVGTMLIVVALVGLLAGLAFNFSSSFFGKEIVVPDIVGMTMEEANKTLLNEGLKMEIKAHSYDDEVKKDRIISQKPAKGLKVKSKAVIEATVSDGPQLEAVPNLVGKKIADAKVAISNAGFEIGLIDQKHDEQYEAGIVMSQDPRSGSSIKQGTTIQLMVSKGPSPKRVAMPSLIGMELEKAREELTTRKLLPNLSYEESQNYYNNYVIKQDTDAGVLLDEESTVNITISKGPGPVAKIKVVKVLLPEDEDYYNVQVLVKDAQGEREVYNEYHQAGDTVNVAINHYGTGTAVVRLNGQKHESFDL